MQGTQDKQGKLLPVNITVYVDKSFDFKIKTPPAAVQLLEAAKVKKGSSENLIDLKLHPFHGIKLKK